MDVQKDGLVMIPEFQATREMVDRKIASIFPDIDPKEIWDALQNYGTEKYEQEPLRVYLAILKLYEEDRKQDLAG